MYRFAYLLVVYSVPGDLVALAFSRPLLATIACMWRTLRVTKNKRDDCLMLR